MKALKVVTWALVCLGTCLTSPGRALAQAPAPDPLVRVRQLYNAGQFDEAITAAQAAAVPPTVRPPVRNEAQLLLGRSLLERHRATRGEDDLAAARAALWEVNPALLSEASRLELVVGLGEALYLDGDYRAAAGLLEPVLEQTAALSAASREQVVDWWATSMDRYAQTRPAEERGAVYDELTSRVRLHLGRHPDSSASAYWLPAAALARGDLDLAWDLALAGWVRSTLAPDGGQSLRADLDRLVTQALIPERVKRLDPESDVDAVTARLTADWEEVRKRWAR